MHLESFRRTTHIKDYSFLARPGRAARRRTRCLSAERLEDRTLLSTFTVSNTDDQGPGSLRQAIIAANNLPGFDTIDFAIPGAGPYTIMPLSGLPSIDDPAIIDGSTQPGYAGKPIIELDGSQSGNEVALSIGGGGSTVRGLVINRFAGGIFISGGGGNHIEGNDIGTDVTGTLGLGNQYNGIAIEASSSNTIGGTTTGAGNVIVASGLDGIEVNGTENTIQGNYIGIGADGLTALGNKGNGIRLINSGNTIGGTSAGAGNVISANGKNGVYDEDGSAIMIQGNKIGTDATGMVAVGNLGDGVKTDPGADVIGGTDPGAGNLISGNGQAGIEIRSGLVQGNKVGTTINGDAALSNASPGIRVLGSGNTIGGTVAGAGNLVSGNVGDGIVLEADDNAVSGNRIGVSADGTMSLGNGGSGVVLRGRGNTIGGTTTGARNVIAGNAVRGVFLSGSGNLVFGNYIGTIALGTAAVGSDGSGIWIEGASNVIGGPSAGAGNLISGNGPQHQGSGALAGGVVISGAFATGNVVQGNRIGTDATGETAVPNYVTGVSIVDAPNSLIGGTQAGEGNLISANGGTGLNLEGAAAGTLIEGNLIGTDREGRSALGNLGAGVGIDSSNITVGGTVSGAGNVISGNGEGMFIGTTTASVSNVVVQGNLIGTQIDGKSPLGNTGVGIQVLEGGFLTGSDPNVTIGAAIDSGKTTDSARAAANTIAFNRAGIESSPFTFGLTYLANSIYANAGLSIDIVPDGVNPNDIKDGTGFGNKAQNYPVLSSAQSDGDRTTVRGTLNSTPSAIFRVEFFANEKTNATRYGDGQRYLGAIMVRTDSDGNADLIATLDAISTGQFISSTATRPGYNTSEFSQAVEVNQATSAPSASGRSISAATTNANDQVVPPRAGPLGAIQSFSFAFDEALDPYRAVDLRNYHLFAIGRTGVVGSSKGRTLALRSATYNSSTHAVTLIPKKALASGLSFKVVVDGTSAHGVSDTTGRLIDGNGDGQPGGDYVAALARGSALSYRDRDGDVVSIKLRGGGVLELNQRADGTIEQLRVVGAVPGRSVLSGRVVRAGKGNGRTTLGKIVDLNGVKNLLTSPRFIVG
jgi:hypothetical protein